MQRILEPGEIQALEASSIPRIRLPERASVFAARAQRLRAAASSEHPIGAYLGLMAALVQAQHDTLSSADIPIPAAERSAIAAATRHSMPVLPALSTQRDPVWREVLLALAERVEKSSDISPQLAAMLARLRHAGDDELEAQADAVLDARIEAVDGALAPFVFSALQVVWTDRASRLDEADVPYLDTPGLCPVCGSPPVASIVRIGGVYEGYRYLQCGLCATETHMVRIKCSHCNSTKGIAYHTIEGGADAIKAESCDECHTYRKIIYQKQALDGEPFADDLASLTLDLLMNEAGYRRTHPHPFLWPAPAGEGEA